MPTLNEKNFFKENHFGWVLSSRLRLDTEGQRTRLSFLQALMGQNP